MNKLITGGLMVCAMTLQAHAQEINLVGDWQGNYVFVGTREHHIGVELKIARVDGSVVSGTAKVLGGSCAGDFQMRGKLDGNNLGMISTNTAGSAGDCKFGFRGTVEGNAIKGRIGPSELHLTKK